MPRDRDKFTNQRPDARDSAESGWRLFIGIDFPESHQRMLSDLLEIVRHEDLPIRWISANTAHLTLQFIGEIPVESAELLRLGFAGAGTGIHPFELAVDGSGAFPNLDNPQVIWLGLSGDIASLRRLHRATETFLLSFDIETEDRQFKPHITLGRTRQALQSPEINSLIKVMRSTPVQSKLQQLAAPFAVSAITLYRSHLSHEGASHEPLAVARLS